MTYLVKYIFLGATTDKKGQKDFSSSTCYDAAHGENGSRIQAPRSEKSSVEIIFTHIIINT
jgi:hypothetical protein